MNDNNEKVSAVPMRGMRDLLPQEVALRNSVISKIKEVYTNYGFLEIETPIVERAELLNTGEGGDNEKQTFGVMRRGLSLEDVKGVSSNSELVDGGLRFDLTVPLTRYYANNQADLPYPAKVLQLGSVFRAERPQKGRYRQFTQCDIDVVGEKSTIVEKELVLATSEALTKIGFTGFTIRVNDRRILKGIVEACGYAEDEQEMVFITIDKLDKIDLGGVEKELLEKSSNTVATEKLIGFLRSVGTESVDKDAFSLLPAGVDATATNELRGIISSVTNLSDNQFKIVFDPTLVRGMGYYTGPIFEVIDKDFPSSIAGGGRYDKMIGKYLNKEVPACGFSIGFERIILLLQERESTLIENKEKKAVIYDSENVSSDFALKFSNQTRSNGGVVSTHKRKKNTKKQLDDLAELGYTSYCILDSEADEPEFKTIG